MAAIAGFNGSVKVNTATVAEIDNWDASVDADMLKTTKFGSQWREQTPGIKSWSGKFSGRWDMTDTTGQKALQDALMGGTSVTLVLGVDATHTYTGTAFIKNIGIKNAADGTVDVDFSFEGTGPLTAV